MEVVSQWHTQRRALAPGVSGREGGGAGLTQRETPKCAHLCICMRERPFPLPSSASPSGIREQQWKGKREGQKDRSVLWSMRAHTHLSSAGAQGDAQASSLPSLPEMHIAYWVLELSWEFNAFTHTHLCVNTHTADFKKVILTHSLQLLAMQATLRGRILARYCRLPWSTTLKTLRGSSPTSSESDPVRIVVVKMPTGLWVYLKV